MEYLRPEVQPESFKSVMSRWPTGVSIITTIQSPESQKPLGILCNSLTSISLEKRLLLWTVDHSSSSFPFWVKSEKWVVHFLADDQQDLVKRFAQKGVADKFSGLEYRKRDDGIPLLDGVVARLHCTTTQRVTTFDHTIILGEVDAMERTEKSPMVYALREFQRLSNSKNS